MPHHFTKTTVQAAIWCNKCGKETPWRIVDGRRQYCLTCYDRWQRRVDITKADLPHDVEDLQGDLFK